MIRPVSNGPSSRGILLVGGGLSQTAHMWLTVTVLRNVLKCELPVEIAYYGEEEMSKQAASDFQVRSLQIVTHVGSHLRPLVKPTQNNNHYSLQATAPKEKNIRGAKYPLVWLAHHSRKP
jgi:hypothetical protein